MPLLNIQNKTRNPYKIPLGKGEIDNSGDRMIAPGMSGTIDADKHSLLMRANRAYHAMVDQDKLRVSAMQLEEVYEDELENTSTPEKPADLLESPEAEGAEGAIAATVESKSIQTVEAPTDDAPAPTKKAPTKKR